MVNEALEEYREGAGELTDEKNIDVKVGSAKLGFIILPNCFGGQKDILFSQVAIGQKDILFS